MMLNAFNSSLACSFSSLATVTLSLVYCAAFAQAPAALDAATARTEVPDGSPALAAEKTVSNTSITAPSKTTTYVTVDEERVQGRLASAHVRTGGSNGYTIVDPNAGRTDRQADNGGKRVSPTDRKSVV